MSRSAVRTIVMAAGLLTVACYALDLGGLVGGTVHGLVWYVALAGCAFAIYTLAAWVVLRRPRDDGVLLALILGFGVLFRLLVLPTPVVLSSDVYRYLWDGRVQRAGINPYRYPPTAPELAGLRDDAIHPQLNRPDKVTIYPPGAEVVFALVTAIKPDSIVAWRVFLLLCELATGVLLLHLLRRMGGPAAAIILYAWSPLVIFEGVQAGHLEPVLIPPMLLALLWRQDGRSALAGAALGLAALVKLYPAALLLAWSRRSDWRFPAACAAVILAGYVPYTAGAGLGVMGFLPQYFGSSEDFNVGLRFFLTEATGVRDGLAREVVRGVAMLLLAGVLLAALLYIRRALVETPAGVLQAGMRAVAAYLVLVPTAMHAWYAIWIVPFMTVSFSAAWFWFTGAVAISYLTYAWGELPLWARLIEYLPLYALLLGEWRRPCILSALAPRPAPASPAQMPR